MLSVDSDLVSRVTDALLDDPRTEDTIIDVSSEGGIVTLSGSVASPEIRQAAEKITRRQEGVISVVNALSIEGGKEGEPSSHVVVPHQ